MPDYSNHHAQAGRIGGMVRAARETNPRAFGERGQRGLMARFLAEVPDEITDEADRARRAHLLLRAHMSRLAMKSAAKRVKAPRVTKGRAA